jgi:hypothetical protein
MVCRLRPSPPLWRCDATFCTPQYKFCGRPTVDLRRLPCQPTPVGGLRRHIVTLLRPTAKCQPSRRGLVPEVRWRRVDRGRPRQPCGSKRRSGRLEDGSRPCEGARRKAERAGFEPAKGYEPLTRLAGECLQPLGHLSRARASLDHLGGAAPGGLRNTERVGRPARRSDPTRSGGRVRLIAAALKAAGRVQRGPGVRIPPAPLAGCRGGGANGPSERSRTRDPRTAR